MTEQPPIYLPLEVVSLSKAMWIWCLDADDLAYLESRLTGKARHLASGEVGYFVSDIEPLLQSMRKAA